MKYYIASIQTIKDNEVNVLEHYYIVRDGENIKDKIIDSIKNSNLKEDVNKVMIYKYDTTIYDDELEELIKRA